MFFATYNNVKAEELKPDLTIKDFTINDSYISSPQFGLNKKIKIRVSYYNQGTTNANKSKIGFYFGEALQGELDTFDNVSYSWGGAANPYFSGEIEILLNEPGSHKIKAIIDNGNIIDEQNETNNEKTITITVLNDEEKPDLLVYNIGFDSFANNFLTAEKKLNTEGRLGIWIKNEGSDLTTSNELLDWKQNLSTINFIFSSGYDINNYTLDRALPTINNPLRKNEVIKFFWNGFFNTAGDHKIEFTVDAQNKLNESNENNNSLEKTIVIGAVASNKINIYEVRSGGETKNSTNIYFNANGNYDCKIKYSNSENYDQSAIGKLVQSGTATNGGDFIYNNKLENLLINTKYFYKVVCTDSAGNTKESANYNFTTLTDYADVVISDVNLTNLAGDAVKITWKTNINTSYNFIMLWDQNLTSGKSYNEETKYGTNHEVILMGLQKNTNYKYYAFARLYDGNSIGTESKYFDFSTTGSTDYQSTISSGDTNVTIIDKDNIANQGKAIMLSNDMLQPILTELKQLRDQVREQAAELKYLKGFASEMKALTSNMQSAIKTFITYGVDENTKKLGEGERAAVINSYEAAFDKLPQTEAEIINVIKIANGRFPSITSDKAEQQAKEQFYKIYNRVADMNNANDAAAIKVMAYGLRQKASNRNLNSEKTGIKTFKAIFGNNPKTTEDWNTMQAITYSGATKKTDSDKDGVADETEKKIGTNPNNADSDSDGYKDGTEVLNGFDPLKK